MRISLFITFNDWVLPWVCTLNTSREYSIIKQTRSFKQFIFIICGGECDGIVSSCRCPTSLRYSHASRMCRASDSWREWNKTGCANMSDHLLTGERVITYTHRNPCTRMLLLLLVIIILTPPPPSFRVSTLQFGSFDTVMVSILCCLWCLLCVFEVVNLECTGKYRIARNFRGTYISWISL